MMSQFHHVALIGKYQAPSASSAGDSTREALEGIAQFLERQGCEVVLEAETARNTALTHYRALDVEDIGEQCDLGLVVGGDGTMLGIGRRLARYATPLIGINQGRSLVLQRQPDRSLAIPTHQHIEPRLQIRNRPHRPAGCATLPLLPCRGVHQRHVWPTQDQPHFRPMGPNLRGNRGG